METRPGLAREEDEHKVTPMHMAVQWDKIDVLRVLLEHDWSLGYVLTSNGVTLFLIQLQVGIRRGCPRASQALPRCSLRPCRWQNDMPSPSRSGWSHGASAILPGVKASSEASQHARLRERDSSIRRGPRVQSQDSQSFAATPGHRRHSAQHLG